MFVERVDNDDFQMAEGNPQVLFTGPGGSRVAGTLQLLTVNKRDGKLAMLEEPLTSRRISGRGWSGTISPEPPNTQLPGPLEPFVWVLPRSFPPSIREECLELILNAEGELSFNLPDDLDPQWEVNGAEDEHGYSLRPTLRIKNSFPARFRGMQADRTHEGSLAEFTGQRGLDRFGVIVDVIPGTNMGLAVTLRSIADRESIRFLRAQ